MKTFSTMAIVLVALCVLLPEVSADHKPALAQSKADETKAVEMLSTGDHTVVACAEDGKNVIRKKEFVLRENDNLFVPALWNEQEIIAYSRDGYENKAWQMPEDWRDVESVDLYQITLEGCKPLQKGDSDHE